MSLSSPWGSTRPKLVVLASRPRRAPLQRRISERTGCLGGLSCAICVCVSCRFAVGWFWTTPLPFARLFKEFWVVAGIERSVAALTLGRRSCRNLSTGKAQFGERIERHPNRLVHPWKGQERQRAKGPRAVGNRCGEIDEANCWGSTTMPSCAGNLVLTRKQKSSFRNPSFLCIATSRRPILPRRKRSKKLDDSFTEWVKEQTKQGEVAILIGDTFHRIRKFNLA